MSTFVRMNIREMNPTDIGWIKELFKKRWGGEFIVTNGIIHRPEDLAGFVGVVVGENAGLVTYKIAEHEIEIVSLDSLRENQGIGTRLLERILELAREQKLTRIFTITTNDNLDALRFWQKRNFRLVRVYKNALEKTRKLKPQVPEIGNYGIPLRDEIELEYKVS